MRILKLRYFKALAESEHLSETAARMYISPSALSTAIAQIEADLGVPLFDRVGRNIRLNENGKKFYYHVRRILEEMDQAYAELQGNENPPNIALTVATTSHLLWQTPFTEFVRLHPDISFTTISVQEIPLRPDSSLPKFDFVLSSLIDLPAS